MITQNKSTYHPILSSVWRKSTILGWNAGNTPIDETMGGGTRRFSKEKPKKKHTRKETRHKLNMHKQQQKKQDEHQSKNARGPKPRLKGARHFTYEIWLPFRHFSSTNSDTKTTQLFFFWLFSRPIRDFFREEFLAKNLHNTPFEPKTILTYYF